MLALEFIVLTVLGLVISFVLRMLVGRRGPGPWSGLLFSFGLLFMALWAAGVWLTPIGPTIGGVQWMPFLLIGVIALLALAGATRPVRRPIEASAATTPAQWKAEAHSVAVTAFFWLMIFGVLFVIFARYLVHPT